MSESTIIRASSLPHYSDCMRRSAAKMFTKELNARGFQLRYTEQSIGAAVGTASHASLEKGLVLRSEGNKQLLAAMRDTAVESLEGSISAGVIWDQTTRNKDEAIIQATRQAVIVLDALPDLEKFVIEGALKAQIKDGWILSGHIDICVIVAGNRVFIYDLKTGKVSRQNMAQYGGYSLLAHANGYEVEGLCEIYVKRVAVHRSQPDPEFVQFDVSQAETAAHNTFNHIITSAETFSTTGDPWIWLPNPNSMMCSVDYCPAYDTDFCNCNKRRKNNED